MLPNLSNFSGILPSELEGTRWLPHAGKKQPHCLPFLVLFKSRCSSSGLFPGVIYVKSVLIIRTHRPWYTRTNVIPHIHTQTVLAISLPYAIRDWSNVTMRAINLTERFEFSLGYEIVIVTDFVGIRRNWRIEAFHAVFILDFH